jgi:hypothetical protein
MYAPSYGFGQGSNPQPFNPNGAPPQAHNPHQQQQQQPGQPQQMMYNPQQYAAPAGPHQSPYGGGPGPGMGPNAGGMGMMQNSGLAHMAGGHGMFAPSAQILSPSRLASLPLSATYGLRLFKLACPYLKIPVRGTLFLSSSCSSKSMIKYAQVCCV